ncbi:MAG: helix-turn-helix domain-containing protein [Gemmatimonadetes bacterium]|nr:helix-turn-helix domain-containing protein [Gemmatimonadota bacterium]
MLDQLFAATREVAGRWAAEAAERRRISATDPVADTLEYCAGKLLERLHSLDQETEWLSTEDYAVMKGVTPQTVRNWIRRGELRALRAGLGFRIRRTEERRRVRAATPAGVA